MAHNTETKDQGTRWLNDIKLRWNKFKEKNQGPLARWRRAHATVKALIDNPEDTEKVFEVIAELRGNTERRMFERFRTTKTGAKVLKDKISLLSTLEDRKALSQMNENSFGRTYLSFVEKQNLTADGLVSASTDSMSNIDDPDRLRFIQRNRDSHDLWHTLTQYGRDTLGEMCLLAFNYAQTKNRGIGLILLLGSFRMYQGWGHGTFGAIWRGYRDGKKASWLPAQPYEELLPMDIDQVRVMLSISEPTAYRLVLSRQH